MNRLNKSSQATYNASIAVLPTVAGDASAGRIERTILVHVHLPGSQDNGALEELQLLAESAGAEVCACAVGRRRAPDAAIFVGRGKAEEIRLLVAQHTADLVLVNHPVSPVQERNLTRLLGCRVLDRTGLILDIFAQRASSHEGKLQVELAQLRHLATRLVRGWTHLERQKGGIGLRGPGETQLEVDRRLIGKRIRLLQRRLQKVRVQRAQRRKARGKVPVPTVSLVGYTNAGKSSLFNLLTGAGVYQADQLFATLDPTMRRLTLPRCGGIILSDTVGFIRHLPHDLIESFRSTLEEVSSADLLLHVVDASATERRDYIEQVDRVLEEIGAARIPQILIFNKIDRVGRLPSFARDEQGRISKVWLSAKSGEGAELLVHALTEHFRRNRIHRQLRLPSSAGELRATVYRRLDVLSEKINDNGEWIIDVEVGPAELNWLEGLKGAGINIVDGPGMVLAHYASST